MVIQYHQEISFDVVIVDENRIGYKHHTGDAGFPTCKEKWQNPFSSWILWQRLACQSHLCFPSNKCSALPLLYLYLKEIDFPGSFAIWFLGTLSQWESSEGDIKVEEEEKPLFAFFGILFATTRHFLTSVRLSPSALGPWGGGSARIIFLCLLFHT